MRFSFTIMLRIGRNLSDGKVSKDNESGLNKCIVPAYFLIFMPPLFHLKPRIANLMNPGEQYTR